MSAQFVIATLAGLLLGLGISQMTLPQAAQSQEGKGTKKTAAVTELDGLKASAAEFEKSFNAGDAKAIAAQFTENAEVVDEDGQVVQVRENIEKRFADIFKEFPKARIEVELTSLARRR